MLMNETIMVRGHMAEIIVYGDGEVAVTVDGKLQMQHIPPAVGAVMLKKCRKVFLEFARAFPEETLWATAYSGDEYRLHREKVFEWCGFERDPDDPHLMVFK